MGDGAGVEPAGLGGAGVGGGEEGGGAGFVLGGGVGAGVGVGGGVGGGEEGDDVPYNIRRSTYERASLLTNLHQSNLFPKK